MPNSARAGESSIPADASPTSPMHQHSNGSIRDRPVIGSLDLSHHVIRTCPHQFYSQGSMKHGNVECRRRLEVPMAGVDQPYVQPSERRGMRLRDIEIARQQSLDSEQGQTHQTHTDVPTKLLVRYRIRVQRAEARMRVAMILSGVLIAVELCVNVWLFWLVGRPNIPSFAEGSFFGWNVQHNVQANTPWGDPSRGGFLILPVILHVPFTVCAWGFRGVLLRWREMDVTPRRTLTWRSYGTALLVLGRCALAITAALLLTSSEASTPAPAVEGRFFQRTCELQPVQAQGSATGVLTIEANRAADCRRSLFASVGQAESVHGPTVPHKASDTTPNGTMFLVMQPVGRELHCPPRWEPVSATPIPR